LGFVFQYGAIALLVVFAPELRAALAHLGQARFAGLFRQMEQREVAEEIGEAIERLSRSGIGAIVAIEREVPLDGYSESGSPVEAKVSADLLTTIFTPYSPLHDGAVLVRGDTIIAAGCILPLSQRSMIDRPLGTRHGAALGGAATAWLVARGSGARHGGWIGLLAALSAGTMMSAWSNATETEVYAVAVLHAVGMLVAAAIAGEGTTARHERWTLLTAYLIALAPAVHLSALVAAPAAIVLAAHGPASAERRARWLFDRTLTLAGATIASAGVGRMQWTLLAFGIVVAAVGAIVCAGRRAIGRVASLASMIVLAASALLVMLVRARLDPSINQGNPATLATLADVVARRQYAVAPLFPRSAPVWLQVANVFQYADWQAAMSWGSGVMTSPLRVLATIAWLGIGVAGWRAMRRDAPTLATALGTLAIGGTFGVAAYLNLKAGASLGWGLLPDDAPHEARERDYFFVLGFWAWGCFAGAGAAALARRFRAPMPMALVALALPLMGNWRSADRSREPE